MKSSLAQFRILILFCLVIPRASSADAINLGLGGINPMPHCIAKVFTVEYEHTYTPSVSILGRGSGVNYHYNDGMYKEDGQLRGLDVGFRNYPGGGMRGFFWGGSAGYWDGNWTFTQDQNLPGVWQGKSHTNSLRLGIDIGDRIPIRGSDVSVLPQVNLGKFFSSHSCEATAPASRAGSPCSQTSEVNYYIFFSVALGFSF